MWTPSQKPTEKDKAKALSLLESLEEWHIAKKLDLLDIDDILDYLFRYPEHINSIRLFLDIVNTQDVSLRDKKLVDFILSFNDEDYLAFINTIWSHGIRFFEVRSVKAVNPLYKDDDDYYVWDLSKQESKFGSEFCNLLLGFANSLLDPNLPTSNRESFIEFKFLIKILKSENDYSVKRFQELSQVIYTYP